MPHIGIDGFTDCDKVCDPSRGYTTETCGKLCPDFIWSKTSSTTPKASTAPIPIETTTAGYSTEFGVTGYISLLLIAPAALFAIYCLRHKICSLWRRWKDKFIRVPVQEQHTVSDGESENQRLREHSENIQPQQPNIITNDLENETDILVPQHKDLNSNDMKSTTTIIEIRHPEKVVPERKKSTRNMSIKNSPNYSETETNGSQYVDVQSILREPEHIYANVNEQMRHEGHGREGNQNISTNSVNSTETESGYSEDDDASDQADTENSENKTPKIIKVVTELRL